MWERPTSPQEKMDMSLNSQESKQQISAADKSKNAESLRILTPEQIQVGTNVIMTHAQRQTFWKNSEIGKLLGFDRWPDGVAKLGD
jgi:hypothetical protein